MQNSFRYMKKNELEEAWTLLEEAMKENRAENPTQVQNGKQNGAEEQVGNSKRKLEIEEDTTELLGDSGPAKKKKKAEANGTTDEEPAEKFNWGETITSILSGKNNELKLKKLKRKVLKKYQALTGGEWSVKLENKFNKKVKKLKGVVVDNDKIRLIA